MFDAAEKLLVDVWLPPGNEQINPFEKPPEPKRTTKPKQHWHRGGNKGVYATNKSGYKGVFRKKTRWVAQIQVNGKRKFLGGYGRPELAAMAYDRAAKDVFGPSAFLNFPEKK